MASFSSNLDGERIVPGRAGSGRRQLVGRPADQLDAGRVHGRDEHHHHARVGDLLAHVLAEEVVVRERRVGRHHLGAGDVDAGIRLLLDGDVDVLHLLGRLGAVDGRIDERVVDVQHGLLAAHVPGAGIVGELAVELGVGAQRVEEGRLVVGAAAHPAVGDARPGGDGVALGDHILARAGGLEEAVRVAAGAGVGGGRQHLLGLGIVQRVIELGDRDSRIAERWMLGDVLDALAVDVDLAAVAQRLQVLRSRERALLSLHEVLWMLAALAGPPFVCVTRANSLLS